MTYEMRIHVPPDQQFVGMVRELASRWARHAGCNEAEAAEFADRVEDSAREQFARCGGDAVVVVTVRQTPAALEVVIGIPQGARTLSLVI